MAKNSSARAGRDDSLTMFQNAMNNLLQDIFQAKEEAATFLGPQNAGYVPLIDIAESEDDFILSVEIPGLAEQDLRLAIPQDKLVVEGHTCLQPHENDRQVCTTERIS